MPTCSPVRVELMIHPTCGDFGRLRSLTVGSDDGATSVYNPKSARLLSKLGTAYIKETNLQSTLADNGRGIVLALKFNPAPGVKPKVRVALSDGKVDCFDPLTGACNATNVVEGGQTLALDYASDGSCYAAGGVDAYNPAGGGPAVRIYDDRRSDLKMTLTGDATSPGHSNRVTCIRFKGSSQLATGSLDGTVKLWSTGCKDPIESFPAASTGTGESPFEVVGPSIDFDGNYMLVGSARPHKHLLIYDLRTNRLLSEVGWRKKAPAKSAAQRRWNVASLANLQKSNILAAAFTDGGKIIAGGAMSAGGMLKVFTPNVARPEAYPIDEAARTATVGEATTLRELYTPVASFSLPSGVMGIDVSRKPVIKRGDVIGEGEAAVEAKEDIKMMAVASSNGIVYGIQLPRDLPHHPEPVI